jgi:hypothetical protein
MFYGLTNTMTDVGNCAEMPRNPRETMEERKVSMEKLIEEMTAEGRLQQFLASSPRWRKVVTIFSPSLPYLST